MEQKAPKERNIFSFVTSFSKTMELLLRRTRQRSAIFSVMFIQGFFPRNISTVKRQKVDKPNRFECEIDKDGLVATETWGVQPFLSESRVT